MSKEYFWNEISPNVLYELAREMTYRNFSVIQIKPVFLESFFTLLLLPLLPDKLTGKDESLNSFRILHLWLYSMREPERAFEELSGVFDSAPKKSENLNDIIACVFGS